MPEEMLPNYLGYFNECKFKITLGSVVFGVLHRLKRSTSVGSEATNPGFGGLKVIPRPLRSQK